MKTLEEANKEAIANRANPEADSLLGKYFPVLDYGFVGLVDYMGNDKAIADAARCSYGAGTKTINDDRNLIRYLKRHAHSSPIEQCELKFHMRLPVFIARQIVRHRMVSLNEYSGRYSVMPLQFYTPKAENINNQSTTNKQGRSTESAINKQRFLDNTNALRDMISNHYKWCLEEDIARELARIDLPLSTYTEWYWKMDLHNLMHFMKLRCDSHAQWEVQEFSRAVARIVKFAFPLSFDAWYDYQYQAVSFSRLDRILLNKMSNSGVTEEFALSIGMSKREYNEFHEKLRPPTEESFDLDLSIAQTPEYFANINAQFVPVIE